MTIAMWFRWDYSTTGASWGYTNPFSMYSDDSYYNALWARWYWSGTTYNYLYWYGYSDGTNQWMSADGALDDAVEGAWTHYVATIDSVVDIVRDLDNPEEDFADYWSGDRFFTTIYIDGEIVSEDDSTLPMYQTRDSMILGDDMGT